ncbi:MAG: uridine kinase [bacterium]
MRRPYLTGIAGGSCSGKTTLAVALAERLGTNRTARVSIDSYYHGRTSAELEGVAQYNFDEPSALDHELLIQHIRDLSRGLSVAVPIYDFENHRRTERISRVDPMPHVILEGLFSLYWDDVRSYLGTKVFIDIPHHISLARRLKRDTHERGRPGEDVIRRYNHMARPMFDKYVLPTRGLADVVVDGEKPAAESTAAIVEHIEKSGC